MESEPDTDARAEIGRRARSASGMLALLEGDAQDQRATVPPPGSEATESGCPKHSKAAL